ncbi:hypothetical protein P9112_010468 [Eukaryota sp. TZLM1-RC]
MLLIFLLVLSPVISWTVVSPENTNFVPTSIDRTESWSFIAPQATLSGAPVILSERVYWQTDNALYKLALSSGALLSELAINTSRPTSLFSSPSHTSMVMRLSNDDATTINFLSPDLQIASSQPFNPRNPVADRSGFVFCQSFTLHRFSFNGELLNRRSIKNNVNLVAAPDGYYGYAFGAIYQFEGNLRMRWEARQRAVSNFVADNQRSMVFFTSDFHLHPTLIFLHGIYTGSGHAVDIFKQNITKLTSRERVVFSAVGQNGDVIYGLNGRDEGLVLRLVVIPNFGSRYGEPKEIKILSENADYQGHVVFPSNLIAVSFYEKSGDFEGTRVVFVNLNGDIQILSNYTQKFENFRGSSVVGFGDLCIVLVLSEISTGNSKLVSTCQ